MDADIERNSNKKKKKNAPIKAQLSKKAYQKESSVDSTGQLEDFPPNEYNRSHYSFFNVWVVSLVLKCLLFFGYHLTDFDVHRNWLAITYNLPISRWYVEDTSQWTLDYPPFFAYFEWALSHLVPDVVKRDGALDIVEIGQYGTATILFQRLTVVVSEVVLFAALQWYINTSSESKIAGSRAFVAASSLILSPGLLIIDHIHFQYNGMMYGFFIFMLNAARLKRYLVCGFWFALLLCFKHIYMYVAPAVFIFLLRAYCLNLTYLSKKSIIYNAIHIVRWTNLIKLGSVVIIVFSVAFGPFVYHGVITNLFSRLFPFSRGLTHAYWAPNIWAVYSFLDRVLIYIHKSIPISRIFIAKIFQLNPKILLLDEIVNSTTRGLVGDSELVILPNITPLITFLLTLFYQIMALVPLFLQPTYYRFLGSLTLCGFASFLFGWHVHEKAILLVIFPATFIVHRDIRLLTPFALLVSCGHVSLFPLLFHLSF